MIIVIIVNQGAIEINFQEIKREDKAIFDEVFRKRNYENSHFNFTNLFMWRKSYDIMWTMEEEILYMKASGANGEFALQPLGDLEKTPIALARWRDYFDRKGKEFLMYGVERSFMEAVKLCNEAIFVIEEDRDNFDYVYRAEDLIQLAGRKYHTKKNHLNSFKRNYPEAKYLPIGEDIITQCKLNINGWYKKHDSGDDSDLTAERNAIIEVLNHFDELKLKGGALMLDNRVIAFTFGERLNGDTAVIHVEKADPDIRGAYTAINQAFVQEEWADMTYINREEDMGIEGLRKAKLSYRPEKMVEKFNIKIK